MPITSTLRTQIISVKCQMGSLTLKLIPEFDGSTSIFECVEIVESMCVVKLNEVSFSLLVEPLPYIHI